MSNNFLSILLGDKLINDIEEYEDECEHESDGKTYISETPLLRCKKCGEYYTQWGKIRNRITDIDIKKDIMKKFR